MVMIVAYDLNRPGQSYRAIEEQLQAANGGYCHAQGSVWFIDSTAGPEWWRDRLMDLGDENDEFFVPRLHSADWRSANMPEAGGWLQSPNRTW